MRQRWVGFVLFLVAVAAGIGAVWTYLSDAAGDTRLVLVDVDGMVRLQGADGSARAPDVGMVLAADDHIETDPDARAVLGMGDLTRIHLGPRSRMRVTSVDAEGVRLELEDGALEATVRPGTPPLRVANSGREVVAINADLAVGVADGVLQVEAREGEVALSGADQTRLEEGSVATLVDRKAVIAPIPEELLLTVDWPAKQRTRAESDVLQGRTAPGARVFVRGPWGELTTTADAEGRFSIEVPLDEGGNSVTVAAVDPLGNDREVQGTLATRDTLGPGSKAGVVYGN